MTPHRAAAIAILAALLAFAGPPAVAQNNAPITNTPNVITPPKALPDLAIVPGSIKDTATCIGGKKVNIDIELTIKNLSKRGTADLTKIPFQTIVSAENIIAYENLESKTGYLVKTSAGGPAKMAPGESFVAKLSFVGVAKFKKGEKYKIYRIDLLVDPLNGIPESTRANNLSGAYVGDPCPG